MRQVLEGVPSLDACIIVIQHMPKHVNASVKRSIERVTKMQVKIAEDSDAVKEGLILIAPSEVHFELRENAVVRLYEAPKVNFVCPSVDVAMQSLQGDPGMNIVGVLLTGMGKDGAKGISHIKGIGGITIAQDKATSTVFGMPGAAVATGDVDYTLPPDMIGPKLLELTQAVQV